MQYTPCFMYTPKTFHKILFIFFGVKIERSGSVSNFMKNNFLHTYV